MTSRLAMAVALAAAAAGCLFGIDPETQRFHCVTDLDCGSGFQCQAQLAGGGLCYRLGDCSAEVCDGQDNDCNGVADDAFDLEADPVNCGACGNACDAGTPVCSIGVCQ